jgi:hypothetical protein
MTRSEPEKCARLTCKCPVEPGNKYCGQACKEAGVKEVEIPCQCDHGACGSPHEGVIPQK